MLRPGPTYRLSIEQITFSCHPVAGQSYAMCAMPTPKLSPSPIAVTHWRLVYVHYASVASRKIHSLHVHPSLFPTRKLAAEAQFRFTRGLDLPRIPGVNGGQCLMVECGPGEDPLERVKQQARRFRGQQ